MRIEDDLITGPDLVGRQAQERAPGTRIAPNDGYQQPVRCLDDRARKIVDGIDVAPGFIGGAVGASISAR
ncbi:hypothetical protein [Bradyrhizobium glycinis]|uniref:hypothetical protein n=1 Tax=Bradyrhizobium glycinis TaxID=2751812 RepID=UPI001FE7607B|nr:hypothetical protein [Bradyrhizobium glycinis]